MSEPTISLRAIIKDETASQLNSIKDNVRQVGEAAGSTAKSFGVLDTETAKLSAALQEQIIKLRAQKELLSDPVYVKSAQQAAQLKKEVQDLTDGLSATNKATEKHGITWSEVVSKYYIASQAIGVLKSGMMSLVEAASKYELLQARLTSVEGSSAIGMRDFKEVQELAKKPGLGFEEAASTFATLRGMKVTAAEAKTLINGIAQANASAAGTAEQFGRVMYQIQQSVSLGRLMQEDLRPIVQAIPTLGAAMQEHFGANQAEQLNKILEKSGKSVRDFWLEVAELGSKLPSTGDTIANNLDNLGDAWTRFKASLVSSSAIRGVTGDLAALIETLAKASEKVNEGYNLQKRAADELGLQEGPGKTFHKQEGLGKRILRGFFPHEEASAQETSVGGAMSANEMLSRMQVAQQYRDDLQARLKLRQEAGDREVSDKKAKDAKLAEAAEKLAESEAKRIRKHNMESQKNVIFSGPNEVTMRDSGEPDPEHVRNRQGAERSREAREKKELEDTQKMRANAQKIRMDWETALIEKKRQVHDEEMKLIRERFDVGQKLASDQVYKMLQGEFTIRGAVNATKDVMFRAFADTTTKWIEEQLIKMVFSKGAQAEETASAVAQASVVGAAWAAPSMATSIATFGGSTATGSAAWFTAMTAAQGYGVVARERGGPSFGARLVGERGPEFERPIVPTVITPAHKTYNTTNAQSITIHVHGGDEKTILRTLRKAGINGAGVSRS